MSDKEASAATNDVNVEKGAIAEKIDAVDTFHECDCGSADGNDQTISTDGSVGHVEGTSAGVETSGLRPRFKRTISEFCNYVMHRHWAELCLSAALLLALLSSLFQAHYAMTSRLVQRKAPPAVRFFPRYSPVTDFYNGNGFDLHKLLSMQTRRHGSAGVLFVMYYAPWCARSMEARRHMENLARYFYPGSANVTNLSVSSPTPKSSTYGPVHFVAVNCWDPNGDCRRSYRLYSYPVFLVYPGTVNSVYYNGVISADYMFRFLENVISPYVRLQSENDFRDFLLDYKSAVIAYFNFTNARNPAGYQSFYGAALKALERDPLRAAAKFAIISDVDLARRLNFTRNGHIRIFRLFSETLDYSEDIAYNAKSISTWIFDNVLNPIRWVSPSVASAGKSNALHEFLTRRPTLILFVPRQPLFDYSPSYTVLANIALRYFDCSGDAFQTINGILRQLYHHQETYKIYRRRLNEFCLQAFREILLLNDCCGDITQSTAGSLNWLVDYRQRNVCEVCYPTQTQKLSASDDAILPPLTTFCERFFGPDDFPASMTKAAKDFLMPILSSRSCDRLINDYLPKSSVIDYCCHEESDGAGARQIMSRLRKGNRLNAAALPLPDFGKDKSDSLSPNCEKLRLSRLLRYVNYGDAADMENLNAKDQHLWAGLSCQTNRTLQFAAMDTNHYAVFARKLGLMPNNSAPLAVIFDGSKEAVYLMDSPLNVDRLGHFVLDFTRNRLSQFYRSEITKSWTSITTASRSVNSECSSGSVCIRAVTSSTFQSIVMDDTKDVMLLYTTRWCGSCQRLFHIYQTLAYYFRAVEKEIVFAQKSESAVFPSYAPWTLPNLVAFVIAHCQRETRLRFALSTCIKNSTGDNAVADSRCLIRNRYQTWRQLSRVERKIRFMLAEVDHMIGASKWDWDHDDNGEEWRVYLQRSWLDLSKLQVKSRALKTILTHSLRRSHFEIQD